MRDLSASFDETKRKVANSFAALRRTMKDSLVTLARAAQRSATLMPFCKGHVDLQPKQLARSKQRWIVLRRCTAHHQTKRYAWSMLNCAIDVGSHKRSTLRKWNAFQTMLSGKWCSTTWCQRRHLSWSDTRKTPSQP